MGVQQSAIRVNFEDIKHVIDKEKDSEFILISTLPINKQNCLIKGTIPADEETETLNKYLKESISRKIIVYGENSSDMTVETKCQQLRSLGFFNIYQYTGGIFEWLLLQDIYGADVFRTTTNELDHLKYRGNSYFNTRRLTYN